MVERRYLLGGIDSDTAYQNIEKDALLNTVNARTVVSRTQNSTNVRFIAGNTEMDNFYEPLLYSAYQPHTPPAEYPFGLEPRYVEKGKCVDGTDIYYFLQDYNSYSAITISSVVNTGGGFTTITTSTNHGFTNGQTVYIKGVVTSVGVGNVNGAWTINNVTSNTFKITYGATGSYTTSASSLCTNSVWVWSANFSLTWSFIPKESKIVKYNTQTKEATLILSEYWTDANLTDEWGLITDNFIDCGVSDNKLFWVDREPRYIDLTIDYKAEYTTGLLPSYSNSYVNTLVPFSASLLSLITEPTVVPLTTTEDTNSSVSSMIQFKALQFCVRLTNQSGFYSVLSPYSLTKLPVRQDEIEANGTDYHNLVSVTLPFAQKIPLNWDTIEYIVRDIETNSFYCINTWNRDNANDVAAVDAHNAGSAELTFADYYGVNKYAIDSGSIAKQFDNVPLTASSLALVANRLLLGDILEGYDTPSNDVSWTTSITPYTTTQAAIMGSWKQAVGADTTVPKVYFISVADANDTSIQRGCYIVRGNLGLGAGVKTYLISNITDNRLKYKNLGVYGSFPDNPLVNANYTSIDNGLIYFLPLSIHYSSLVLATNQNDPDLATKTPSGGAASIQVRMDIVQQAFYDESWTPDNNHNYAICYPLAEIIGGVAVDTTINVLNDQVGFTSISDSYAFTPSSNYKGSIRLYDEGMRPCGVYSEDYIQIPNYETLTHETSNTITVTVPNTTVPSWAKYFSFNFSKEQNSNKTINFIPDAIKFAIKNSLGEYKFVGANHSSGFFSSYTFIGAAIPFSSVIQYGYGYDYKSGDSLKLSFNDGSLEYVATGTIVDYKDGYLITNIQVSDLVNGYSYNNSCAALMFPATTSPNAGHVVLYTNNVKRQGDVLCEVYIDSADINTYEVAAFGRCSNNTTGDFFNGTTSITLNGDNYLQQRASTTGCFPSPAYTPNEQQSLFVVNNLGRITLEDRIGQKYLPTAIRWSNTFIPSAQTNGYSSFDSLDIKVLEPTATKITRLIPTTKGTTEGSQLLVLCTGGSFVTLVGKAQLFGADQQVSAVQSTNSVLGEVNPLTGNWTCQSPKSAVTYQGLTFWADSQNRDIIQFGANGATPVSAMSKCSRLFRSLFMQYDWGVDATFYCNVTGGVVTGVSITDNGFGYREGFYEGVPITGGTTNATLDITVGAEGTITGIELASGGAGYTAGTYTTKTIDKDYYLSQILGSVNPYTNEYMIAFDQADPKPTMPDLATTTLVNPYDCYTPNQITYIYNWNLNRWVTSWQSYVVSINVGDDVYSVARGSVTNYPNQWVNRLWREFNGVAGSYYGTTKNCMISIPFNGEYPTVKAPLTIIGDMSRYPDEVWIEADGMKRLNSTTTGVANTQSWYMREGDAMANILRDRRSLGDDDTKYTIAGIKGQRLKGKSINVCLIWYGTNGEFTCSSVGLKSDVASGHT